MAIDDRGGLRQRIAFGVIGSGRMPHQNQDCQRRSD
jgi:hypothetical protein